MFSGQLGIGGDTLGAPPSPSQPHGTTAVESWVNRLLLVNNDQPLGTSQLAQMAQGDKAASARGDCGVCFRTWLGMQQPRVCPLDGVSAAPAPELPCGYN